MEQRTLSLDSKDRVAIYTSLGPQLRELLAEERDLIAAMANFSALLKESFGWHWIGFYRVVGAELVLGPFQGPVACVRIGYGKGVCGMAWQEEKTLVVPDVDKFPGHIACDVASRSELVVPMLLGDRLVGVLDIDSPRHGRFTDDEARLCEDVVQLLVDGSDW